MKKRIFGIVAGRVSSTTPSRFFFVFFFFGERKTSALSYIAFEEKRL